MRSSPWKMVPVGECCELIVDCINKTAPTVPYPTPYKMIRTTNVRDGFVDLTDCKYVTYETYRKWTRRATVQAGDVVLTREAPIGQVGLIRGSDTVFLGQRLMQYRANRSVLDPEYLVYAFMSPLLQSQFRAHEGSGSVVSHIRVGDCFKFQIPLPPLSEQRRIVALLSALDEQLLLLRSQNTALESIAQAVFKSWFIDFDPVRAKAEGRVAEGLDAEISALFPDDVQDSAIGIIPRGWRCGTFGELAEPHMHSVNPLLYPDTVFEHYSIPAYDSGQLPRLERGDAIKSNKTVVPLGCVLQSKLNPHIPRIWLPGRVGSNAICSTEFVPWVPRPHVPVEYLYCLLKSPLFTAIVQSLATGTSNSHQRVRPERIFVLPVLVPPPPVMAAFQACVAPLLERVVHNRYQAQTLASLRDTLLPQLISGRLRVPEAEEALKEVL